MGALEDRQGPERVEDHLPGVRNAIALQAWRQEGRISGSRCRDRGTAGLSSSFPELSRQRQGGVARMAALPPVGRRAKEPTYPCLSKRDLSGQDLSGHLLGE